MALTITVGYHSMIQIVLRLKMKDFEDKIILVTGSASGIGRDAAVAFASRGGTVIGVDLSLIHI